MSDGNNTANISLAVGIIAQLLESAGTVTSAIQTAQAAGTDITDEQIAGFQATYASASAKLGTDIDAAEG